MVPIIARGSRACCIMRWSKAGWWRCKRANTSTRSQSASEGTEVRSAIRWNILRVRVRERGVAWGERGVRWRERGVAWRMLSRYYTM